MSSRWAIRLDKSSASAVGAFRLYRSVEIHESVDALWLRGNHDTEDLTAELRRLPAAARYTASAAWRLTALGARVPAGALPDGPWQSLAEWLTLDIQPAALPGDVDRRVPLRLVRTGRMGEPSVVMTHGADWNAFAASAPLIRLERLAFAMAADGRVVVRGRPLPAMPGTRFVAEGAIAVPCGYSLAPAIGSAVLREVLGLSGHDLAIMATDGTCELVRATSFVPAGRAAVRLSCEGYRNG